MSISKMLRNSTVCGLLFLAVIQTVKADGSINATWYNSYCSQVSLSVDESSGLVTGTYTSHTGSVGSSRAIGWFLEPEKDKEGAPPVNPKGTPIALGIQWRLINKPVSEADGSWHWVSNFSGQYHPEQTVEQDQQLSYQIPETLEILNSLVATATVEGFTTAAPVMWPQTLKFHKTAPTYCKPVTPPKPVPFSGSSPDHISGTWKNSAGDMLVLSADLVTGSVTGTYTSSTSVYSVVGFFDNLGEVVPSVTVAEQGVTLMLKDNTGKVLSMAGGADFQNTNVMVLWEDDLKSTTWTSRFIGNTVDKVIWNRLP